MFSGIVVLRRLDASPTLPNAHTKQLGADVGLAAPCFTLHEDSGVVKLNSKGRSLNAQAGRDIWYKAVLITSLYIEFGVFPS